MLDLGAVQRRPPAQLDPARLGRADARLRSLADQCAFKLRQRPHHVEDQSPLSAGGVEPVMQRLKADTALPQIGDDGDQMRQRPPQPIQPPNNERVTRSHGGEGVRQSLAAVLRARCPIHKNPVRARIAQGSFLKVQVLVTRGHACIADFHAVNLKQDFGTRKYL